MEWEILGNGQDEGAPRADCSCRNCESGIQAYGPSIRVSSGGYNLLVDTPPDIKRALNNADTGFSELDAVVLTHAHMGHYGGLLYLGREAYDTDEFPVHCSEDMAGWLKEGNKGHRHLVERGNIDPRPFETDEWIELEEIDLKPVEVNHRNEDADTVGLIFKEDDYSLFYMPDLDEWTEKEEELVEEADHSIVDGTFYSEEEIPRPGIPHPPVRETIERFEDVESILFTHLNHTNPLLDSGSPEARSARYAMTEGDKIYGPRTGAVAEQGRTYTS